MTFPARDDLPTPALVIDLPALERNIAAMAGWARENNIVLRPHAKTHKSGEIAKRQIEAGAVGICCAKLGEAESLAAEGVDDILITSPVVPAQAIERLVRLNRSIGRLAVVVDHPDNAARLDRAMGDHPIDILVDIDPGTHRTGVASKQAAIALVTRVAAAPGLNYRGVQYYCGSLQHIAGLEERRAALAERDRYLNSILEALEAAGLPPATVTGGGTGSFAIDAELGTLNELQVGSYIFMDREYSDCDLDGEDAPPFETSLMVDARVISANATGLVTIDAGLKSFATEAGAPPVMSGAGPDARYRFMGDEHGAILGEDLPGIGARVTLGTPHCDPTVNLYDAYHVVRGDVLTAIWPVTARGCGW